MCEYCEKGKGICKGNRKELGIELHSGSGHLTAYGTNTYNCDISVQCKINYCPMCGRKLVKELKDMNKTIENIAILICVTIIWVALLIAITVTSRDDEKIKYLEQSLNEQIEEKQVYMNMLEEERSNT